MAVTFATDKITRDTTQWTALPENILVEPELNGRHEHTDVSALAADIYANGQNSPCLIRKNADGKPVLVYGHRRYRAVVFINQHLLKPGEEKVELLCNYAKLDDEGAFLAAVTENHQRAEVNDMDHCHNIGVWRKRFKKSLEQIAAIYFPEAKTPKEKADALRWVENRADLAELAPEAAQAVRAGEVKITAAVELAKLSENQQRKVIADAKTAKPLAGGTRIKVSDVKAAAGKAPAKANKPAPKPVRVSGPDPDDVPFDVPRSLPMLPSNPTLAAAELMARAIEVWETDATSGAEKSLLAAKTAYRALVPLVEAKGKAA